MASVTSTATPTLRVNAAKGVEDKQQPHASRIQPPEGSASYDHFFWTYTEEPHRSRRQAIIKAHPEVCSIPPFSPQYGCLATTEEIQLLTIHFFVKVTKLCGPEPLTKWLVLAVVSLQITCAYLFRDTSMFSWKFFLTAYVIGATSNQNLFLAIHEISHNLAFRSAFANRLLAIFANLPIGLPYSAAFRVS